MRAVWQMAVIGSLALGRAAATCPKPGGGSINAPIVSNPNRPTVSNPADVTQLGVLEIEYGWTRTWPGRGDRADQYGGLFRFGMLCDLELRVSFDSLLTEREGAERRRGLGDTWTGLQYRFLRQRSHLPSMAFGYALKEPTASVHKRLGSGRFDHAIAYLASKDMWGLHADFTANYLAAGRPHRGARDHSALLALAVSRPIKGPLAITGEIWGTTRVDPENPGFTATLWALSYSVNPRLTMDGAVDFGLMSGAPRKRIMAGFTYALGRVYDGAE